MTIHKMMSDGTMVDLAGPIPAAAVDDRLIAQELARIARYGGSLAPHVPHFSVAEHSVLGADLSAMLGHGPNVQRAILFHDAHEALTGDILGPVKRLMAAAGEGRALAALEARADAAVELARGVAFAPYRDQIKVVDRMMEAIERRHLMLPGEDWPGHGRLWEMIPAGYPQPQCWNVETARVRFLAKMAELFGVRS